MTKLTYSDVEAACRAGGATVLTAVTELAPAAGPQAGIAPARFVQGRNGTYAYETRYVDREAASAVVVDGKASQINRIEDAISLAIQEGDPGLTRMPHILVDYGSLTATDYQLPHRFTDGHIRFGSIDGESVTKNPAYVAARNTTPANARALLELSPVSLVFGSWDSTRKSHQARYRSCALGEIIGVLADQTPEGKQPPQRGAARKDDIAPSVQLNEKDMVALLATQEAEMSPTTVAKIKSEAKKAKSGVTSASVLGLGAIPPSLDGLGFVACKRIIRSQVLSFSALRQLRFGLGIDGDVACRALLAALALHGLALANEELNLRANCDLVEADDSQVKLDGRRGTHIDLEPLARETTAAILDAAINQAESFGIKWSGQEMQITGNPVILGGITSDADEA